MSYDNHDTVGIESLFRMVDFIKDAVNIVNEILTAWYFSDFFKASVRARDIIFSQVTRRDSHAGYEAQRLRSQDE